MKFRNGHYRRGILSTPPDVLFWRHVDKSGGPDACWPFTGYLRETGYGQYGIGRKGILAHRAAYMFSGGDLQAGAVVRHLCDNPPCCNPAHLAVGSQSDNVADMMAKGRQSKGAAKSTAMIVSGCAGETHTNAKLSSAQVAAIRDLGAGGGWTHRALAKLFGVSREYITRIINKNIRVHG